MCFKSKVDRLNGGAASVRQPDEGRSPLVHPHALGPSYTDRLHSSKIKIKINQSDEKGEETIK